MSSGETQSFGAHSSTLFKWGGGGGGGGGYQCHGNNWTSTVYILAENPDFSYIESRLMQKDPPESVGVSATHVSNMTAASNIYGQYPENRYQ